MTFTTADLLPISDVIDTGGFTLGGSSPKTTFYESINVSNASVDGVAISVAGSFSCGLQPLPAALSVEEVIVRMQVIDDLVGDGTGSVRSFVEVGGVRNYGAWFALPDTNYHDVDDVIAVAFTPSQLRLARIGWESGTPAVGGRHTISFLRARVSYVPEPVGTDAARDIASRRVWLRRRGDRRITITGGPWLLDYRPGTRIELSHFAGPHSAAAGWRDTVHERRPLWVESLAWNPALMQVTLVCIDHRSKLCLAYDSGFAKTSTVTRDGLMRMSPGALWTMDRASRAECLEATGQLVSVPDDVEAFAAQGQIIQSARSNAVKNSAFGLTGIDTHWTSSGEGSNGSSIDPRTDQGLWTLDLSPRCVEFVAGSPIHVADLQHQADTIAGLRGDRTMSVYHQDTGGALSLAAQRAIDSKWYRASDQTWQAAKTWNPMTQRSTWARDQITMDVGATATNVDFYLGVPTATGSAGQRNWVSHSQVEAGKYASSPIYTTDAAYTRAADDLRIENNAGKRVLDADQFTVMVECEPFWNPTDLTGLAPSQDLWYAYHDANNNLLVEWFNNSNAFFATLTANGVSYTASCSATPARGTRQTITVRFTGHRGDLGLAPYTLDIFVGATKGTSVIAAQPMIEAATAYIQFSGWDGYIRQRFFSPQVLTDTEIARGI